MITHFLYTNKHALCFKIGAKKRTTTQRCGDVVPECLSSDDEDHLFGSPTYLISLHALLSVLFHVTSIHRRLGLRSLLGLLEEGRDD